MSHLHFGFLGLFLLRLAERRQHRQSTMPTISTRRRLLAFLKRRARQQAPSAMRIDDHLRGDVGLPPLDSGSRGRGRRHS
jgi:hypothetical protein